MRSIKPLLTAYCELKDLIFVMCFLISPMPSSEQVPCERELLFFFINVHLPGGQHGHKSNGYHSHCFGGRGCWQATHGEQCESWPLESGNSESLTIVWCYCHQELHGGSGSCEEFFRILNCSLSIRQLLVSLSNTVKSVKSRLGVWHCANQTNTLGLHSSTEKYRHCPDATINHQVCFSKWYHFSGQTF